MAAAGEKSIRRSISLDTKLQILIRLVTAKAIRPARQSAIGSFFCQTVIFFVNMILQIKLFFIAVLNFSFLLLCFCQVCLIHVLVVEL